MVALFHAAIGEDQDGEGKQESYPKGISSLSVLLVIAQHRLDMGHNPPDSSPKDLRGEEHAKQTRQEQLQEITSGTRIYVGVDAADWRETNKD